MLLLLLLLLTAALSAPAAATDLVYDDGGENVLDSYESLEPCPTDQGVEVRDGPSGDPTSLDVALGHRICGPPDVEAYGSSVVRALQFCHGWIGSNDTSTLIIEEGASSCLGYPSFSAYGQSTVHVRESVDFATAKDSATVHFEEGHGGVLYRFRAEGQSNTTMWSGGQAGTILVDEAVMTVFGGVVGYDATELYDNAVLVVDGGSVGATYGLILNGSSRADLHSSDRVDPFAYFITRDTALLQIFGADFRLDDSPVGPGDLSGVSGVLAGTLESGDALSVEVGVAATATLRLVPEPGAGAAMLAVLLALWGVGALRRRAA